MFRTSWKKIDEVEEENYFFRLSKYQEAIRLLIESGELEIIPEERKNEILNFVRGGLNDISISRSNKRANWGVPVPGDRNSRLYVWMDALNIYQSGIGFGWDDEKYNKWWPADLHVIGKGIIRFHAVYWPAFLMSAGLKLPKKLFVHSYYTVNGQKMSKTLGKCLRSNTLIEKYGGRSFAILLSCKDFTHLPMVISRRRNLLKLTTQTLPMDWETWLPEWQSFVKALNYELRIMNYGLHKISL